MLRLKFQIILIILLSYFISFGQADRRNKNVNDTYLISEDIIVLVLKKMEAAQEHIEEGKRWHFHRTNSSDLLRIRHEPSEDFNIYLRLDRHITPQIRTAIEVSLNYSGVVNLTSQILLRKRKGMM